MTYHERTLLNRTLYVMVISAIAYIMISNNVLYMMLVGAVMVVLVPCLLFSVVVHNMQRRHPERRQSERRGSMVSIDDLL